MAKYVAIIIDIIIRLTFLVSNLVSTRAFLDIWVDLSFRFWVRVFLKSVILIFHWRVIAPFISVIFFIHSIFILPFIYVILSTHPILLYIFIVLTIGLTIGSIILLFLVSVTLFNFPWVLSLINFVLSLLL